MRITGGQYRGRKLQTPNGNAVRPASDKVRQAVFNMLQSYNMPGGAHVLDLFCGTGSYGLEALSRGAKSCDFIDTDISLVTANIQTLSLADNANAYKARLPKLPVLKRVYDLVFIDPPYHENLVLPTLQTVRAFVNDKAVIIVESEASINAPGGYDVLKDRQYAAAHITLLSAC